MIFDIGDGHPAHARRGADGRRVRPRPRDASLPTDPGGDRRRVPAVRLRAGRAARVEVGGAYVEFDQGDPGRPERPLLNHLAVLVDSADEVIARRRRARDRGRVGRRRSEHVRGVSLGPGSRADRVRRAQADVLADVIVVAGAGMAGLVAAARLRELGREAVVREKGTRLGGSMLLSSCVIWRHRDVGRVPPRVPRRRRALQRLVWERLDDALDWLDGARRARRLGGDGKPAHGRQALRPARARPRRSRAARGEVELGADGCVGDEPTILCTGGFAASSELVRATSRRRRRCGCARTRGRQATGSTYALERGAALSPGLDEFYGRNMPDSPWDETEFVVALAAVRAVRARSSTRTAIEFFEADDVTWSETNVVQATAHRPRRAGVLPARRTSAAATGARPHGRRDRGCGAAGGPRPARGLPFEPPAGTVAAVRVVASITHTIGGLRVDERARVLRVTAAPIGGLWAAGVDAGGVATGGYASGLAQALVLGLVAAEDAAPRGF